VHISRATVSSILVGAIFIGGCTRPPRVHEVTPALQQVLAGDRLATVEADTWTDLQMFYTDRAAAPAWVDERRPTERAADALEALNTARQHGFDAADYDAPGLLGLSQEVEAIDKDAPERLQRLAAFDVRLSAALLSFARDVASGRTSPKSIDAKWERRPAPDFSAGLSQAVDDDPLAWIESVRPPHPEYAALQKAMDDLHGQREKGGWPKVAAAALKRGASVPAVAALRQRLSMSGHLQAADAAKPNLFDAALEAAVKSFQELHGIKATGVADAATLAAINVPLDARIAQVAINLERWRWMPADLGDRHLIVNIPRFHLEAREHGKVVMDIRVVVGKPGNNTPLFSDEMETVVLSPYWNIPDTIAEDETAPAVARDPAYLARQNIEILRVSDGRAETVRPSDVDWDDPEELKGLAFRQRPGAGNALGHVKFMFPNEYDVYLHDTPADALFARPGRAFSHGCVRVEEPEALAKYVLRDFPEWDEPTLFAAMQSGVEKHVRLKATIPVHLVYFTAWVDARGGLHFQPDVYGYDKQQRDRSARARTRSS
jgi:murein L,D-transpeptidase YcbB/YkuD